MANVNEARQANMGSNNGGKTDWQKQLDMLSMAALAQGANPATMAGFALGKWLGGDKRSDEEKQAAAMQKPLSHEERVNVYNSIVEKGDEITQVIHDAVDKSLRDNKLKSKIQSMTSQLLGEYKKSLEDARILID